MLWLKAFHVIAVVCWFAGLFYLPRLFVYHAMSQDPISLERFQVMERKLYRGIMWPSLLATWALGLAMVVAGWDVYRTQHWLHVKLLLVVLLLAHFIVAGRWLTGAAVGRALPSSRALRWINEIPLLAFIPIVWLVLAKPF